ncbi:trypco2 family protein [Streptomyces collinus]|uniref:trypco2 family protein n=1 Tax=Streptomyces collinus TaxID=42684 RepID=UPI002942BB37|nr:trypco2 family protein [Streptomyces collinus]
MGIPLAQALAELRRELYQAQDEGAMEQFRFEVEQAEVLLDLEFRSDGKGGVKVEVGVLGAKAGVEAGGELGHTHRQTLKLTLQVRDEALGGQRARISRATGGLDDEDNPQTGRRGSGTFGQLESLEDNSATR